jgi:ABC-type transport system involved in cytochrome c biogenesis permease subunit
VQQAAIITFWFALAAYTAATVLYAYFFWAKRKKYASYATYTVVAGFVLHTASIGLRWAEKGSFPFQGIYESLTIAAWALVLVYFVVEYLAGVRVLGVLLIPAAIVMMVIAFLNLDAPTEEVVEVLDSWRVGIHVVIINLANAGFAIGAAASGLYLVQEVQLKRHTTNMLFRRLPPLASTDRLARRVIAAAFPAYTAGILLGTIRAIEFDVTGWYLDPRVLLAFVVWGIYGTYLYLRFRPQGLPGRTGAWIALAGFVVVVIVAIVARTVPSGFHIFGL